MGWVFPFFPDGVDPAWWRWMCARLDLILSGPWGRCSWQDDGRSYCAPLHPLWSLRHSSWWYLDGQTPLSRSVPGSNQGPTGYTGRRTCGSDGGLYCPGRSRTSSERVRPPVSRCTWYGMDGQMSCQWLLGNGARGAELVSQADWHRSGMDSRMHALWIPFCPRLPGVH